VRDFPFFGISFERTCAASSRRGSACTHASAAEPRVRTREPGRPSPTLRCTPFYGRGGPSLGAGASERVGRHPSPPTRRRRARIVPLATGHHGSCASSCVSPGERPCLRRPGEDRVTNPDFFARRALARAHGDAMVLQHDLQHEHGGSATWTRPGLAWWPTVRAGYGHHGKRPLGSVRSSAGRRRFWMRASRPSFPSRGSDPV